MDPGPGLAGQLQHGRQGDRLRRHRDAGQTEPGRHFAVVGDALAGEEGILRLQPDRKIEGRRVHHGAQQHLGIDDGVVGLAEGDAAGLVQLRHLGQCLALQLRGQGADGMDVGELGQAGAVGQHFDQAGLVKHRVGVRRAGQPRHAAGGGGGHFGFERGAVFEARLAQARGEVDQAGTDDAAGGIQHAVGFEARRRVADADDAAGGDEQVLGLVGLARRIDQAAIADMYLHLSSPPTWP